MVQHCATAGVSEVARRIRVAPERLGSCSMWRGVRASTGLGIGAGTSVRNAFECKRPFEQGELL